MEGFAEPQQANGLCHSEVDGRGVGLSPMKISGPEQATKACVLHKPRWVRNLIA